MALYEAIEKLKFDVRLREKNLRDEVLKPVELRQFLDSLADSSAQIEKLELNEENGHPGDYDDFDE